MVLVGGLCLGVVALASACGGGSQNAAESEVRADQLLNMTTQAFTGVEDVHRVGAWTRTGHIVTAWVSVSSRRSSRLSGVWR